MYVFRRLQTAAAVLLVGAAGLFASAPVRAQGYPAINCNDPYYYQYCQQYYAWYQQYYGSYYQQYTTDSYDYSYPYYAYGVPVGVGLGFGSFHHHRGFHHGGFHGGGFHGGGGHGGHR